MCVLLKHSNNQNKEIIISSSDEKTGIQAISHTQTSYTKIGQIRRIESEYIRNGTTCLIASKNISTGQINAYNVGQTRKEEDYLKHVKEIVATDINKEHIIICDQLNTHKSESLVEWIANMCYDNIDLGIKGKKGILKSQKSRMKFLENQKHKVRFYFTPKHCSWINPIENWFGILGKKVIKHGEFGSVNSLEQQISDFIDYYNKVLSKPLKWTFYGAKYRQKLAS